MAVKILKPALLAAALAWSGAAAAAELQVVVRPVAHDHGSVKLALYSSPETFRKEDKAQAVLSQPAVPGEMTFRFDGLAAGRYAIVVYHDEDGNGRMDRFLGMIPTEGWGLSNNPEVSGPPQFDPSAVTVTEAEPTRIVIDLRY